MEMKNTRSCSSEMIVSQLFFVGQLDLCKIPVSSIQQVYFISLSSSNPTLTLYLQSADNSCSPNFVLFLAGFCESSCSSASLTTALALIPLPTSCFSLGALLSSLSLVLSAAFCRLAQCCTWGQTDVSSAFLAYFRNCHLGEAACSDLP